MAGEEENGTNFPNWVVYLLIGVVIVLISIVGILICCVLWKRSKRRRVRRQSPRDEYKLEGVPIAEIHTSGSSKKYKDNVLQWTPEQAPLASKYPPIHADNLLSEYKKKNAENGKPFEDEFDSIPRRYQHFSSEVMNTPENSGKNRFPKEFVGVYDYNRVRVTPTEGDESSSDYINASFLKKTSGDVRYIATQGPLKNTLVDFWKMVWEYRCNIIIMLCDLWRDNMMEEDDDARTVHQFHYTSWRALPESMFAKVPEVQSKWMKFISKINQQEELNGDTLAPLVVHCSAGTAETGIFICLDLLKEDLKNTERVDPYTTLAHLRQQRPNMIHFAGQYQYVFRTLLEQHLYGDTEIDVAEIRNQVFKDQIIRQHLHKEFTSLEMISVEVRSTTIGTKSENAKKNRYPNLIIPFDDNMVLISPRSHEEKHTSYINASWVDSYWEKQAFIITQDPSVETAPEFWRMLWEHHVTAVVMLTEPGPEPTQCHHYWPHEDTHEQKVVYGNFVIRYDASCRDNFPGYSVRTFQLNSTQQPESSHRKVLQFHYHDWPNGGVPKYATSLLDMLARMRFTLPERQPVAVHCSGGGDRSSVFCALNLSIEQLKDEGKIDVLQTTRLLRHQRQYMVPSEMEYEFIYKAILEYIETNWSDKTSITSLSSDL